MSAAISYTILPSGTEVVAELERKKSRFLTVMRRADSVEEAQELVDSLRKTHHSARHHCSAWVIGAERGVQRGNDDGEPSGTAGAPMLEALLRTEVPCGTTDLSDVAVVVVRWFGGTLLGAGGLVSAYSDSVVAVLDEARRRGLFLTRRRMRLLELLAPITDAGRWEHDLRRTGVTVLGTDYGASATGARLRLAVEDSTEHRDQLHARVASLSAGRCTLEESGVEWVDV